MTPVDVVAIATDNLSIPPSPSSRAASAADLESFRPYLLSIANQELDSQIRPKIGASDVVQESLLEAHQAYAGFQGRTAWELRTWLKRILRNNLSNQARHFQQTKKRQVAREVSLDQNCPAEVRDRLVESFATPTVHAIHEEDLARLEAALAGLPEPLRQIIVWRSLERMPFSQIAQSLKRSEKSVQKQWSRAVRELRNRMSRQP